MGKRNKEDYIPLHEAARVYGYTRDHLGYLIRKGDLKGQKLGSFSSSAKSLSPYFTTHKWIKEYLIKSGKARKSTSHINQSISSPRSFVASLLKDDNILCHSKNLSVPACRQTGLTEDLNTFLRHPERSEGSRVLSVILSIAKDLKKEFFPLWQDLTKVFNKLKKNFNYTLNSVIFLLKDIEKEVKAWQVEAKYLIKRTKKKIAHSKIIKNTIEFVRITLKLLRQGIDLVVFLPKESIYQSRQLLTKAKSVFLHQWTSTSVALKKVQREILWRVSIRSAKNRKTNLSFNVLFSKINPKLIGSLILLIGLTLSSFGIYISSPDISETFNTAQTKLANILDKISQPVYVAINNSDELAQLNKIFTRIGKFANFPDGGLGKFAAPLVVLGEQQQAKDFSRKTNQDSLQSKNFLSSIVQIRDDIVKKAKIRGEMSFSFIKQFNHLVYYKYSSVFAKSSQGERRLPAGRQEAISTFCLWENLRFLTEDLSEAKQSLSSLSLRGAVATKQSLIVILNKTRDINDLIKNNLHAWQSSNNRKIARIDNKLARIKTQALMQINKGSHEQLAQLSIDFNFIKKHFAKLKGFIAMRWGIGDKITELEQKVAKLEGKPTELAQNQEGAVLSGAKGLIVLSSTENDEENKKKIKQAFSDEVTIEPDETGSSGIIKPIFRKPTDQSYLYVLVPMQAQ